MAHVRSRFSYGWVSAILSPAGNDLCVDVVVVRRMLHGSCGASMSQELSLEYLGSRL